MRQFQLPCFLQTLNTSLPRHQAEEETDKIKQVQIEQTFEKH